METGSEGEGRRCPRVGHMGLRLIIHAPKNAEEATGIASPLDRQVRILLQFNC